MKEDQRPSEAIPRDAGPEDGSVAIRGRAGEVTVGDVAQDGTGPWKLFLGEYGVAQFPSKAAEEDPEAYARSIAATIRKALADREHGPILRSADAPLNPPSPERDQARLLIARAREDHDALDFGMGLEAKIIAALRVAAEEATTLCARCDAEILGSADDPILAERERCARHCEVLAHFMETGAGPLASPGARLRQAAQSIREGREAKLWDPSYREDPDYWIPSPTCGHGAQSLTFACEECGAFPPGVRVRERAIPTDACAHGKTLSNCPVCERLDTAGQQAEWARLEGEREAIRKAMQPVVDAADVAMTRGVLAESALTGRRDNYARKYIEHMKEGFGKWLAEHAPELRPMAHSRICKQVEEVLDATNRCTEANAFVAGKAAAVAVVRDTDATLIRRIEACTLDGSKEGT